MNHKSKICVDTQSLRTYQHADVVKAQLCLPADEYGHYLSFVFLVTAYFLVLISLSPSGDFEHCTVLLHHFVQVQLPLSENVLVVPEMKHEIIKNKNTKSHYEEQ